MIPYLDLNAKWHSVENPGGLWTLKKKSRQDDNALQISSLQRRSGEKLVPELDPEKFAVQWATNLGGVVTGSQAGECAYGRFGTAVFKQRQFPYCQFWTITNGVHLISATYICNVMPEAEELRDVAAMVLSLKLIDDPH